MQNLYPSESNSLLELCCYHGSVRCFKLLLSKFHCDITEKCLSYSFLSGNADIMNECLKEQDPDDSCMEYAIIAHNIDFISFLMNEFELKIDLTYCVYFNNFPALLVYLDQTKDINSFFIASILLDIPMIYKFFLSVGIDVNVQAKIGTTALQAAISIHNIAA